MSQIVSRQAEGGCIRLCRVVALELSRSRDITDLPAVVDQLSVYKGEVDRESAGSKVESELSVVQRAHVVDGERTCLRLCTGIGCVRRAARHVLRSARDATELRRVVAGVTAGNAA